MKNIYIETIAPLLRGLTFDGEKGNISIFEDDSRVILVYLKMIQRKCQNRPYPFI
jgi:hypothetical protein